MNRETTSEQRTEWRTYYTARIAADKLGGRTSDHNILALLNTLDAIEGELAAERRAKSRILAREDALADRHKELQEKCDLLRAFFVAVHTAVDRTVELGESVSSGAPG